MLAAGSMIGRRYRLDSLIGEGGMASVWRAADDTLKRSVAIKLLYLRPARDPQASVDQFLREARIAAAVQHRNVVHTVDFGTTDEGIPYMVMELLQGESLAARMNRLPPLSVEELVRIAELTLRGLSAVHEAGIVHRDLKPQNIFLQQEGDALYPKILDFGISRSVASEALPSPIATQQGIVLGTPHYMAPEQARGEATLDQRVDIYSMGAILYEGLTGQLPFDADNPGDLLVKIISTEPVPLAALRPDIPELLLDCIGQAMARDREHRFVDAGAFRRALGAAAERCLTTGSLRRSELPARALPMLELPSSLQPTLAQNDVSHGRWGDFEGLEPRVAEPRPASPLPASVPRAASAARGGVAEPGRVAKQAEPARSSAVDGARAGAAPEAVRGPAHAEPARAGSRAGSAPEPIRVSQAEPMRAAAVAEPVRSGSNAGLPRVAAAGAARASAAEPRVSQPRTRAASGPLSMEVNPNDGPLLGDNPLDAFAGSAAVALELDLELPRASAARAPVAAPAERRSTAQAQVAQNVGLTSNTRRERRGGRALWILPGLLLLLLCLLLIAPGLFSYAVPPDSSLRAREEQNPATRGSSRTLQRERPTTPLGTPPAERELWE